MAVSQSHGLGAGTPGCTADFLLSLIVACIVCRMHRILPGAASFMGEPQQLSLFGKVQIASTADASFSMTAGHFAC